MNDRKKILIKDKNLEHRNWNQMINELQANERYVFQPIRKVSLTRRGKKKLRQVKEVKKNSVTDLFTSTEGNNLRYPNQKR